MSIPTLRDLCRSLGDDLAPVAVGEVPATGVTAVHVSELADPTTFLDGGELLLTLGLGFQPSAVWFSRYVQRLVSRGVAALALGLGPAHATVPAALAEAAGRAGLPLLVVPPPTPFLSISRRYWSMIAESGQRELAEMLSAHRSLLAASLGAAPVPAVLRRLAVAIDGWAAHLAPDGLLRSVWPADRRGAARELQGAVYRLHAVGAPTALSLPLGDDDIVVQPIGDHSRLLGYLAVGHARPMPRHAQQLAMTAVALLTLESVHAGRLRLAARGSEAMVLDLLRAGQPLAARRAASFLGIDLPDRARVALVGDGQPGELLLHLDSVPRAAEHVLLAGPGATGDRAAPGGNGAPCCLLLRDQHGGAGWLRGLIDVVPGSRGVLAAPADLDHFTQSLSRAEAALAGAAPGTCADLGWDQATAPLDTPELRAWARRRLRALDGDDELVATVAAVLRCHSELDAARDLAVHRHTIRNRVRRIESLLGARMDDPDARSELWLALRLTGRC
ncbi:MAG TPA: helix-turn-helix domain-containing protein [Trebonia sp.]|nr:helix-turn-helix domain-containing protein [Trebonia sp.]